MEDLIAMLFTFGPLFLMFVIMYFMMIKPQKKRDQAVADMRSKLEVGNNITTIGGVMGRIVAIRDDQITVETGADRVKLHFTRWSIQSVTENSSDK